MNPCVALTLKRAWLLVLLVLIAGCTPDASSNSALFQDVPTFIGDFARQILTALLL
jgi:hypothetical protein